MESTDKLDPTRPTDAILKYSNVFIIFAEGKGGWDRDPCSQSIFENVMGEGELLNYTFELFHKHKIL